MSQNIMSGLGGQRVIVTAGAGGIGEATVRLLHAEGCRIALCDVSDEALGRIGSELPGITTLRADVSDEGDVARFFEAALSALGGLDALVNNAGIAGPTGGVEDISVADWRRCLDIGLTGQFLCARLAVPHIKAAGGGAIVNMSSSAGRHGYAYRTPYAAAKWGVVGFTQSLAKELGPSNIRVNAVLPGIVEGPRMDGVIRDRAERLDLSFDEMKAQYLQTVSLRRMVTPQDVAASIAFLMSDAGRNLSAMSFNVDGNVETL
ncbi:NAD(P)-dependent dehydrogenase, short-chain alcohol dehydrogenase family [Aureimonas altamirensis DSM 21988]|uniref:NAD(P)-dependent dehydrogenase, short-chain alcohol dehydrogenase family n=1 Tax=Aureimonas altamirensis DSM 21988 TaxID=1121026 RepID=A0ABY1I5A0_9HYPH|nr:SDR family oxidoreductase [Aureimonas altamirensis]SHI61933.1 NAD(P)-dependent dehydrogenase, short-chain alcohol dehydrogenase family [Aureimonas altamirensis DSM 21988]